MRAWLRKHVRSLLPSDMDDLMQEAYARLWRRDFTSITNGRGYLYTTVRHLLLEQARRARIVPMERMGEIESLRAISDEPGPERRIGARQEFERVQQIIQSLPVQWRRAFELQRFQGLSQREIAADMGISEKTVEKHLSKALARIIELSTREHLPTGSATGTRQHERTHQQD